MKHDSKVGAVELGGTLENGKPPTIPPNILDEVIQYIERMEVTIDSEWGSCMGVEELIRSGRMPKLYGKLVALRKEAGE